MSESKSSFTTSSPSSSSSSSFTTSSLCYHFLNALHAIHISMEELKLFAIINWIFHVSDFLRLFVMSFKYRLILLRHFLTDCVLFLSPLLFNIIVTPRIIYSYWFVIIFFFMLKRFFIYLIILSLIALVSFSSLKIFLVSLIAV